MEFGDRSVNLPMVAKDKKSLSVTRMLATQLMENPYMKVGDFIGDLSDTDLEFLVKGIDLENGDKYYADYILICMMLASAEGVATPDDDEEFSQFVDRLIMLLAIESLGRKGLIKVYRENMSFGEDAGDKIVCEKIDGMDYKDFL